MKRPISLIILAFLVFVFEPLPAFSAAKLPQLLLKSFLPLPDSTLIVFGKMLFIDPTEIEENLNMGRVELFFHHRAKNLPLTISIGNARVQTQTNDEGDFSVSFPGSAAAELRGETTVTFTSSQFPSYQETATYNLPAQPQFLIVSDIDDSVLVSSGGKFYKAIGNALFKPVHKRDAVPGTPEIYRALITGTQGTDSLLVFLSGSPVYLAPRIEIFFKDKAFPEHSLILQNIGPKELFWDRLLKHKPSRLFSSTTMEYKLLQLGKLFKWYPDLPVILLGDSLEKDPEVYQKMAENYPGKVRLVVIRNLTQQPLGNARYEGLRILAPLIVWNDPAELRDALIRENLIAPSAGTADQK
ncbi:MAG TPA: phosphatase domain-containing protein [Candidatus Ozemobacteraceae bacterium]